MAEMLSETSRVDAMRRRFSSLQRGFTFFDAPGGTQVPDEVGEAIARALREASANMGAVYETSHRVEAILAEAEGKAARFLGCDPHEVIFGANMTSLDFMLSRTAGRGFDAGDEILVSSLDHDGGVAPWLELAHDKDLLVRHVELRDDTTLDYDDLAAKLTAADARGRLRLGLERRRHGGRRRARVRARPRGRRAGLDRRRPLRRARADRRARDRRRRADLLALQVLRPPSGHGLRPGLAARDLAPVQGPAGADDAARPPVRDRHPALRAARRASTPRSITWGRSAGSRRSSPTSAGWANGSWPASRTR